MNKPLFFIAQDGTMFVWKQQRPGSTFCSRERFTTPALAVAAGEVLARCNNGLFKCPTCGSLYDPTHGGCPTCAAHRLMGDPIAAAWVAQGSPACGATWEAVVSYCFECGEEIPEGAEHQDDDGHYYHPGCCPGCYDDGEGEMEFDCPKCGKEALPF